MASLVCSHAIVSKVTPSLSTLDNNLDMNEARRQHESLVRLLRELGLEVVEVPACESSNESVFIEDTAIVLNGTALMAKPSQSQRNIDVENTRAILKGLNIITVDISDKDARIEGGDVLFTGREFFIGLSKWSNELGAKAVAETFPEYPCTPIKIPEGGGKLQSYVSVGGPDVLCVGQGPEAQSVLRRLERAASFRYHTLTLPEDHAANCLYINSTLVHRAIEEIPQSFKVFCEKVDFSRRSICFSELAKLSRGLTSACLLVRESEF